LDLHRLKRLYRHSIAALVPSLCYETFGLVALEAFAQGAPAIVHDLGALPETVRDGGGMTYKTADELVASMEKLRNEPAVRAAMVSAAQENLKSNYTEQRHLTQYYDMIAELKGARSMQEVR
jgi:glycosyltransferase involved in cell wall biosynthesis